jgi:hypothetical protein
MPSAPERPARPAPKPNRPRYPALLTGWACTSWCTAGVEKIKAVVNVRCISAGVVRMRRASDYRAVPRPVLVSYSGTLDVPQSRHRGFAFGSVRLNV